MFIENIYFSETDQGRFSGFDSMSEKKEKKIIKIIQKEKERTLINNFVHLK